MKVIIHHEFSDEERVRMVTCYRVVANRKGLPKLATGKLIREFVAEAIDAYWVAMEQDMASEEDAA